MASSCFATLAILLEHPRSREFYPLTRIDPPSSNDADCKRIIFGVRSPQPHPFRFPRPIIP